MSVGHCLGPGDEQLLGFKSLVKEDHAAARVRRPSVGDVGLVAPVVKDGHVAVPVGPAPGQEELR
eukprot:scaffold3925_cov63-Phaeocystis_antarctica.AAC.1